MRPECETVTPVGIGPSKVATVSTSPAGRSLARSSAAWAGDGIPARARAQGSHAKANVLMMHRLCKAWWSVAACGPWIVRGRRASRSIPRGRETPDVRRGPSSLRFAGRRTGPGRQQFPRNDVGRRMTRAGPNAPPGRSRPPSLLCSADGTATAARRGPGSPLGDRAQRGYRLREAGRNRDWQKTGVGRQLTAGSDVQPAPLHGVADQVRPAREAELLQRPGLVGLHRLELRSSWAAISLLL